MSRNTTAPTGNGEGDALELSAAPIVDSDGYSPSDPEHGVYVCTCGREWDAIRMCTTTCRTCGNEGQPWQPSPAPPWAHLMPNLGPNPHPRDVLDAWRDAQRKAQQRATDQPVPLPAPKGSPRARLHGLVQTVLDAQQGERNTKLHWAACRAGEMVAAGEVDLTTATAALQDAGLAVGLTSTEVGDVRRGTIGSGLTKTLPGGAL